MALSRRVGEDGLYTLGGGTLLFSETDTSKVGDELGYNSLGNMSSVEATFDPETLEHFTSQSGKRVKDEEVVSQLNGTLTMTVDELSVENVRYFFYGGSVSDVAATTAVSSTAYGTIGSIKDLYLPRKGADNVVVKSAGGTTTYSVTTDYTVGTAYEMTYIRWVSTGSIGDGDEILVEYDYTEDANKKFDVLDTTQRRGKAQLILRSDAGQNMRWIIPLCQLSASGAFGYTGDDWTEFTLELALLEDSSDGFGYIEMPSEKWNT